MADGIWDRPCAAVLFDMDGTLVDSTALMDLLWTEWAVRHGVDAAAVLRVHHGRRAEETLAEVSPAHNRPELIAELLVAQEDRTEGVRPIPGVAGFAQRLPASRWAVVTSATRRIAEVRLAAAGIAGWGALVGADDVARGKPAPDPYLLAAARLGVAAADCVVVEDAPAGIASALAAGMRCVAVATTYPADYLASHGPHAIVNDLAGAELADRLTLG